MNTIKLSVKALSTFIVISLAISCGNSDDPLPTTDTLTITGFSSDSLVIGETLTIQGTSFSSVPSQNQVIFNGAATTAQSATTTELEVIIPEGSKTGEIKVMVDSETASSEDPVHILEDIPRDGMLFFLPFDENAMDITNGIVGEVHGASSVPDRFEKLLSAYNFDGDDYIIYPNDGLNPSDGLTVSFWIYLPENNLSFLLTNQTVGDGPGGYSIQLGGDNEQIVAGLVTDPGNGAGDQTAPLPVREWVNVTMTVEESYLDLWINGNRALHHTSNVPLAKPHNTELVLGASLDLQGGGYLFQGILDDLIIYDRVLPEQEILQLFNQTVTSR